MFKEKAESYSNIRKKYEIKPAGRKTLEKMSQGKEYRGKYFSTKKSQL
jgi:hypothetical protein